MSMDELLIFRDLYDMLRYPFAQNALLASLLASLACGIMGTFVVHNRLTFLAGGASHAAYGGIGAALYFQWPLLPCTLLFSLLATLLMGMICLRRESAGEDGSPDAVIGVLWAAGMAVGIILVELTPGYAGELMGFLFGSILAVSAEDLAVMAAFDGILLLLLACFHQGLWAITLDREFARARGLPVNVLYLLLVGLTAVAVVMLIRIVGLILVLALISIPAILAARVCRSLYVSMFLAAVLSLLFCLGGLVLSWSTNISSGASIIAVAALWYFLAQIFPFARQGRAASRKKTLSRAS